MTDWLALGIAVGIGLLIGMQREWSKHAIAGIRTFPLIALLGSLAALLAEAHGGWIIAAGLLAVAALLLAGRLGAVTTEADTGPGITTEIAALLTYAIGAILVAGYTNTGIVLGGVTAVLLQWRRPLHHLVEQIGREDFRAITQLVLVALVVLPLLPDRGFGWYGVLNPFRIWLMVTLIMAISLAGYVAYRVLGTRSGAVIGGLLGGLVSSTATTVSYARQCRGNAAAVAPAAVVMVLAAAVVYPRIALEIGAIAPALLGRAAGPIGLLCLGLLLAGLLLYRRLGAGSPAPPDVRNPAQLRTALVFAGLYALIVLVVSAARERFGTEAVYAVSLLAGLTDVDAMTLSMAELFRTGQIPADTAWRAILLASLSNLFFKGVAVAVIGGTRLLLHILLPFALTALLGTGIILLWPG